MPTSAGLVRTTAPRAEACIHAGIHPSVEGGTAASDTSRHEAPSSSVGAGCCGVVWCGEVEFHVRTSSLVSTQTQTSGTEEPKRQVGMRSCLGQSVRDASGLPVRVVVALPARRMVATPS